MPSQLICKLNSVFLLHYQLVECDPPLPIAIKYKLNERIKVTVADGKGVRAYFVIYSPTETFHSLCIIIYNRVLC